MDWKIIGFGALVNIILTPILTLLFFPLFFLGPVIGGFLSSYLTEGFENYDTMDEKDGAVVGALSGLIGGIILSLLYIIGFGGINTILESVSIKLGIVTGSLVAGVFIINISATASLLLGLIGGIIGVLFKK
jgi:hypothetical protein